MILVAIAGPPGAGKSALARALAARLPGAIVLDHDHYEAFTRRSPQEIVAWLESGAPYDVIDVSALVSDLEILREGGEILDRGSGHAGRATRFVILETPFGRAHPAMRAPIDFLVWLDVPADVAVARHISGFVEALRHDSGPGDLRRFVDWLDGYLENYIKIVRPATVIQKERVAPGSDLTLTEHEADVGACANSVVAALKSRGLLGMAEGVDP